jgi:holo-[acyl-carrier protein] synthase
MTGVGIDTVEVENFRKKRYTAKASRSLRDFFSEQEIQYCFAKKDPAQHLAARFAAKEAAWKALAGSKKIHMHLFTFLTMVELLNDKDGAPRLVFSGALKKHKALVSLSHTRSQAAAVVLLLK